MLFKIFNFKIFLISPFHFSLDVSFNVFHVIVMLSVLNKLEIGVKLWAKREEIENICTEYMDHVSILV